MMAIIHFYYAWHLNESYSTSTLEWNAIPFVSYIDSNSSPLTKYVIMGGDISTVIILSSSESFAYSIN